MVAEGGLPNAAGLAGVLLVAAARAFSASFKRGAALPVIHAMAAVGSLGTMPNRAPNEYKPMREASVPAPTIWWRRKPNNRLTLKNLLKPNTVHLGESPAMAR